MLQSMAVGSLPFVSETAPGFDVILLLLDSQVWLFIRQPPTVIAHRHLSPSSTLLFPALFTAYFMWSISKTLLSVQFPLMLIYITLQGIQHSWAPVCWDRGSTRKRPERSLFFYNRNAWITSPTMIVNVLFKNTLMYLAFVTFQSIPCLLFLN